MEIMQKIVNVYNYIVDFIAKILAEFDVKYPEFLDKDLEITAE